MSEIRKGMIPIPISLKEILQYDRRIDVMPKPYMVRINFPRQAVTKNKGTKDEFKTSIMDVYYDSLEDAESFYPKTDDTVDLTNVYGYNKLIWRWESHLGI